MNYRTPDLIERQRRGIRRFIGNIPIRIIDGSGNRDLNRIKDHNFSVEYFDYNIHHGPGAEHAIKTSKFEWILLMDSDRWPVKTGIMRCFNVVDDKTYMVCHKLKGGPLPFTILIRTGWYDRFDPFILHGAPFRDTFHGMWKTEAMKHFPFEDYTNDLIGGTRKKYGLRLNEAKHIDKNVRKASPIQSMLRKRRAARLRKLQNYRKRRYGTNV